MKQILLSFLLLSSSWQIACAVPAFPGIITFRQPDGTELTITQRGDEFGHLTFSSDGYPLVYNIATGFYEYARMGHEGLECSGLVATPVEMRSKEVCDYLKTVDVPDLVRRAELDREITLSRRSPKRRVRVNDFPTLGRQRSLVILVEFTDCAFSSMPDPYAYYDGMLNQPGFTYSNGAHGSAHDYYTACSNGLFDPQFDVVGPIQLPHDRAYYGENTMKAKDAYVYDLVLDACQLADEQINFADYDLNGDGVVDNIYFFYAGQGEADSGNANTIWPHSAKLLEDWNIEMLELDGVFINRYAMSNEVRGGTSPAMPVGIGTFVHEFAHVLGLADHYDTMGQSGRQGVQEWDTMAAASYHDNQNTPPAFSAFERAELGWMEYTDISSLTPGPILVPVLSDTASMALRIMAPDTDGKEYFVIENRQQNSWDATLPGHGLLVWHVDMDEESWLNNQVNVLSDHQRLDIIEADGSETTNSFASDPFPGTHKVNQFDFYGWNGQVLFGFDLVSESDTAICLLLSGTDYQLATPVSSVSNVHGSTFSITWTEVPEAAYYSLTLRALNDAGEPTDSVFGFAPLILSQAGTYTFETLEPNTTYQADVVAHLGSYCSSPAQLQFTTTELEFFEQQPQVSAATDVSPTGFLAHWLPMAGATGYAITLYEHLFAAEEYEEYAFDDKEDGMPEGWQSTSSTYNRAMFGQKAPSLQLGATDDELILSHPNALLTSLEFWQRSQNSSNLLHIEQRFTPDGEWQEVASTKCSTSGKRYFVLLDSCQTVRIRLERLSSYALIDDVSLGFVATKTVPVDGQTHLIVDANTTSYSFDGLSPNCQYGYCVRGIQGDVVSRESTEVLVQTLSSSEAITTIGTDEASEAAYYDLQGRRLREAGQCSICIRNHRILISNY